MPDDFLISHLELYFLLNLIFLLPMHLTTFKIFAVIFDSIVLFRSTLVAFHFSLLKRLGYIEDLVVLGDQDDVVLILISCHTWNIASSFGLPEQMPVSNLLLI